MDFQDRLGVSMFASQTAERWAQALQPETGPGREGRA